MQDYYVLNEKEVMGVSAVFEIATSTDTEYDKSPIATQGFIQEHAKDMNCRQASCTVRLPSLTYTYDRNGFLPVRVPTDGTVQNGVLTSLQPRLLYYSPYPTLAEPPGEKSMYGSMRREYYWLCMVNESYTIVRDCC